jgi:hypothetical protein
VGRREKDRVDRLNANGRGRRNKKSAALARADLWLANECSPANKVGSPLKIPLWRNAAEKQILKGAKS